MAAKYVPPGRRATGEAREQRSSRVVADSPTDTYEPRQDTTPKSYLSSDICNYFDDESSGPTYAVSSTLHASASSPDSLAFVMLFHGANPRWATDHILFVKSNLHLLRTETVHVEETATPHKLPESVAVFEQRSHTRPARFQFVGYYKVTHVDFLSPRTADLVRMLEQKWTKKDRHGNVSQIEREGEAWKRSLNQTWAVVKFEKDEAAEKEKGTLELPERSVNELLQEMRIRGSSATGAEGATAKIAQRDLAPVTEQIPDITSDNIEPSITQKIPVTETSKIHHISERMDDAIGSV
jgi:hypothetical protein